MNQDIANNVRDNPDQQRFELDVGGHVAFSQYHRAGDKLVMLHTEVPPELGGRGIGSQLVRGILDIARTQSLKVDARCPFVKAYLDKHTEYADLRV
jgi:hypothetical protein